MPDISFANLHHWCVVWQRSDTKTKHGQPRVSSPINVRCRWVTADQSMVSQEETREIFPRYIQVGQEIALGSYVWGEGKIEDLPSSPVYLEVVGRSNTPDLKGRHPVYTLNLQKASGTLPEVA